MRTRNLCRKLGQAGIPHKVGGQTTIPFAREKDGNPVPQSAGSTRTWTSPTPVAEGPVNREVSPRRPVNRPEWQARVQLYLTVTDAIIIAATLGLAQYFWLGSTLEIQVGWVTLDYAVVGTAIALIWLFFLAMNRSRQPRILASGVLEYQRVLNSTLSAFGTTAILAYLLQVSVSRGYFLIALPLGALALVISRWAWRQYLDKARRRGRYVDRALLVGSHQDVNRLVRELSRSTASGLLPTAYCPTDAGDGVAVKGNQLPVVARREVVARAAADDIDVVVVAGDLPGGREAIRRLGWDLEGASAELILVSRLTDIAGPRLHLRPVEGLPLVYVTLPQFTGITHVIKRLFDIVFALAALVALIPVFFVIAIAIVADDGRPVFFTQTRVGARGRTFRMVKFRSMRRDAEAIKAQLMDQDEGAGVLFKMKDDPRVTRVGKVLRRLSLDELPQFFNVLTGSMSVVGPRPPLPDEVAAYDGDVSRRLLIKPGITGLWQVSGRSNLSWEESVRLDLAYVENWSVTGDVALVARTVMTVLRREGAY